MEEIKRDELQDVVMNVKIHDQVMLGWVNENNKYIIPKEVVVDILNSTKVILRADDKNNVYMYTRLMPANKVVNLVMSYALNDAKDKVFVKFSVIEEYYIAEGTEIRQIDTEICKNLYPYSNDVLEKIYKDYKIVKKEEDDTVVNKLEDKSLLIQGTATLHRAVSDIASEDFEIASIKVVKELIKQLKKSRSSYGDSILKLYNDNVKLYKKYIIKGQLGKQVTGKVQLDLINNAIESANVMHGECEEKLDFDKYRLSVMNDYKQDIKNAEAKAEQQVLKTMGDKQGINTAIKTKAETEKLEQQQQQVGQPYLTEILRNASKKIEEKTKEEKTKEEKTKIVNADKEKPVKVESAKQKPAGKTLGSLWTVTKPEPQKKKASENVTNHNDSKKEFGSEPEVELFVAPDKHPNIQTSERREGINDARIEEQSTLDNKTKTTAEQLAKHKKALAMIANRNELPKNVYKPADNPTVKGEEILGLGAEDNLFLP